MVAATSPALEPKFSGMSRRACGDLSGPSSCLCPLDARTTVDGECEVGIVGNPTLAAASETRCLQITGFRASGDFPDPGYGGWGRGARVPGAEWDRCGRPCKGTYHPIPPRDSAPGTCKVVASARRIPPPAWAPNAPSSPLPHSCPGCDRTAGPQADQMAPSLAPTPPISQLSTTSRPNSVS